MKKISFALISVVAVALSSGCGLVGINSGISIENSSRINGIVPKSVAESNAVREVGGKALSERTKLMTLREAGAHAPEPMTPDDLCYLIYVEISQEPENSISGSPTSTFGYRYARLVMDAKTGLALSYVKSAEPV